MDSATQYPSPPENYRRTAALGHAHVIPDEILCTILAKLAPRDVARLSCVSSVMYVLCNEEPLWMSLCLSIINRPLEYMGSWKRTTLHQLGFLEKYDETHKRTLYFEGFSSLFLYRRLYRCHTSLSGFSFDDGNVRRRDRLSVEEFDNEYDGKCPVLINGLADSWAASKTWTCKQLLLKYPETKFRISQRSPKKLNMKFKDYVHYMQVQRDEDPLYIFDDKFGESAPDLLKDYAVPNLFQEDYFNVLDIDQRPPFRWLIIGPERSGASWHVDPGLTSAWNTLLCGRKRWALYPPGRVPLGVTVHVNEDDGDVDIETPSSLQWWLDFYPLLSERDKPIECTQLPGETIYVPSGWWHCVLNLETSIAVTQNYVNSRNFEFVCLDMAPGYQHKGISRAGLLALDGDLKISENTTVCASRLPARENRVTIHRSPEDMTQANNNTVGLEYSYDINFLAMFLDKERDHYTFPWSPGNCIGQREMRDWLSKLWVRRPELKDLVWKGACLALNVEKWCEIAGEICSFHGLSYPLDDEKLPVGTGSNPVFLVGDYVIKIFAEGGLENSLFGLGTELEFHNLLNNSKSSLKNCVPSILASGIVHFEIGSYRIFPWDGKGVPEGIFSKLTSMSSCKDGDIDHPFGVWGKKLFEYRNSGKISHTLGDSESNLMWPYLVTRRCTGKIFANVRNTLSRENLLALASFLGEQVHNLHALPLPKPPVNYCLLGRDTIQHSIGNGHLKCEENEVDYRACREVFVSILNRRREYVTRRLTEWGEPIPHELIKKVDEYLPINLASLFQGDSEVLKPFTWIHSDIMDDNIYMEPCCSSAFLAEDGSDPDLATDKEIRFKSCRRQKHSWNPSYILDFSDLSIGDPLLDLIPIYIDVFRGDSGLLEQFLDSYRVPVETNHHIKPHTSTRPSYRAMCYCILHEENLLGAIFSLWKELRNASSWQDVEDKLWGDLNKYSL